MMGKIWDAMRAGAEAVKSGLGPGTYAVGGRQVRCGHCGEHTFLARSAPSSKMTALYGTALVCTACSHVELFADMPQRM